MSLRKVLKQKLGIDTERQHSRSRNREWQVQMRGPICSSPSLCS